MYDGVHKWRQTRASEKYHYNVRFTDKVLIHTKRLVSVMIVGFRSPE